jgi:hypothetical protein
MEQIAGKLRHYYGNGSFSRYALYIHTPQIGQTFSTHTGYKFTGLFKLQQHLFTKMVVMY